MIRLIHGDCLEEMNKLIAEGVKVDCVVTDPPYGIKINKATMGGDVLAKTTSHIMKSWDDKRPDIRYFNLIKSISKNQIIFGGNYFTDFLQPTRCWLIWDKDNGLNDFADCELVWTSFNKSIRKIKHKWAGMLQQNMKEKEKHYHPTQKPLKVMEWIILNYTEKGDTILDPFMGSGTTGVACKNLDRNFIGIELDKDYFDIAKKRIEETQVQENLFNDYESVFDAQRELLI